MSEQQPENKSSVKKINLNPLFAGVLAVEFAVIGGLFFQQEIVGALQAGDISKINEFARAAGEGAQRACADQEGIAASTYENITSLYDQRVIMKRAPFTPGALAQALEALGKQNITVRAPTGYMGLDTDALFVRDETGAEGGTLLLGSAARYNELSPAFMARVKDDAAAMAPGSMLVLHGQFASSYRDADRYKIVSLPAGATYYRTAKTGNPFPDNERYELPVERCALR